MERTRFVDGKYLPNNYAPLDSDSQKDRFGKSFPKELWDVNVRHAAYFFGRDDILHQVKPILTDEHRAIALVGASGSGKTRLVAEYAYRNRTDYMKGGVLLLPAQSEQQLLENFQKSTKIDIQQNGLDTISEWLAANRESLVIFDHIEDESLVNRFASSDNHVVFTTTKEIPNLENIPIPESVDNKSGALILLKRAAILKDKQQFEDASAKVQTSSLELSQLLGNRAASVEAAGDYIEGSGSGVIRCLDLVQQGYLHLSNLPETRAEYPYGQYINRG